MQQFSSTARLSVVSENRGYLNEGKYACDSLYLANVRFSTYPFGLRLQVTFREIVRGKNPNHPIYNLLEHVAIFDGYIMSTRRHRQDYP